MLIREEKDFKQSLIANMILHILAKEEKAISLQFLYKKFELFILKSCQKELKDLEKRQDKELVYKNNIRYAINYYLLGYSLVERVSKANYIITDLGLQWLEKFPYTAIPKKTILIYQMH